MIKIKILSQYLNNFTIQKCFKTLQRVKEGENNNLASGLVWEYYSISSADGFLNADIHTRGKIFQKAF